MRDCTTRITYGALALRPGGSGVQTYIRELLSALPAHLGDIPLAAVVQEDATGELPASIAPLRRPVADGVRRAVHGVLPTRRGGVFHGLDVDLPVAGPTTTVATVHDLSVLDMPSASSRFRAAGESVLVRATLRRADVLIAVSEFTAERIREVCGRDAYVTELAPAAWARPPGTADIERVRTKYELPERFVLQIGTVEPRKNVALVASAARRLGIPCVLGGAGSTGPDAPSSALGLGYVDVDDLPGLYAAATVTAYASFYEGYGLPPVEAMACGGAVVASAVGALPQVVGDGAVLVERHDEDAWVRALEPLVRDSETRRGLVDAGTRVGASLSWDTTARRTVEAYRAAGIDVPAPLPRPGTSP
ncbi:glycosyltransferase family 1 protein [Gordonia amicalis]|nr:glycosyltransferase family 1 protein [Gordonia amicalis]MBA5848831.1 glycosyltransferase family 4 protein [Gordonia amicalis]MDV7175245.1 glycosyltransferase family 1 protein [Gordonia amicalis]NKX76609.1 glycosyltransferase family 4 protein [Gordonia amicalis]